ncbi:MAG: YciI family protein [Jatrophihabitantaceae bacterium]
MRFLMFVCVDTEPVDASSSSGMDIDEWVETMDGRGARLVGDVLEPASAARAVRVRNNETLVTDGPFVESKEIIAGFDVLECADLDEAVKIAAAHPMARGGVIEIRPFAVFD